MDLNRTSFSELSTLARCEQQWFYKYLERLPQGQTAAMERGSFLHQAIAMWWQQPSMTMTEVVRAIREDGDSDYSDESFSHGAWLCERYDQYHSAERAAAVVSVIGTELRFEMLLPGTGVTVLAFVDELLMDDQGRWWGGERKSMNGWQRLETLAVDPQVSTYIWIIRATGIPVVGMRYDAINTYRWKPEKPTQAALKPAIVADHPDWAAKDVTEEARRQVEAHPGVDRPVADSFEQRWIDRSDEHIEEALADMRAAVLRRNMLAAGLKPIRSIGQQCRNCAFQAKCWDSLAFGQDIEIVDEAA